MATAFALENSITSCSFASNALTFSGSFSSVQLKRSAQFAIHEIDLSTANNVLSNNSLYTLTTGGIARTQTAALVKANAELQVFYTGGNKPADATVTLVNNNNKLRITYDAAGAVEVVQTTLARVWRCTSH